MLKLSKRYSKLYTTNIYKLNKSALRIQHWYFRTMYAKYARLLLYKPQPESVELI